MSLLPRVSFDSEVVQTSSWLADGVARPTHSRFSSFVASESRSALRTKYAQTALVSWLRIRLIGRFAPLPNRALRSEVLQPGSPFPSAATRRRPQFLPPLTAP